MAACYVTRDPKNQYKNIPLITDMQRVLQEGQSFKEKHVLLQALNVGTYREF
jgi:hypothetical protein